MGHQAQSSHLDHLGPELPADLAGRRVLDVGPVPTDPVSTELRQRNAEAIVHWDPGSGRRDGGGGFDLVVVRDVLQSDPHPAVLFGELWEAASEGATMLLQSRAMVEIERSRYAAFVGASAGTGSSEWLPGRLALRWSIETSGFDVERWISAAAELRSGEADVYLVARRTDRRPALQLATPTKPQEVADDAG